MPAVGTPEKERSEKLGGDAIPTPRFIRNIRLNNDPNLPQANESWEAYAKRYNRERDEDARRMLDVLVSTCQPRCAFPGVNTYSGKQWRCPTCNSLWRLNRTVKEWYLS